MKNLVQTCFLSITLSLLSFSGFSQAELSLEVMNPANNMWESHEKVGVCPGVQRDYRIINYRADCHRVTIKGTSGAAPTVNSDGTFSTGWFDAVNTSTVEIENFLGSGK